MSKNTFRRGHTTFACVDCGHLTRNTGVQPLDSKLCPDCWELAGIYNAIEDGSKPSDYADEIRAYTQNIVAKGGKLSSDWQALLKQVTPKERP